MRTTKDMQEDKELTFDAIDTVKGCISLFDGMLATIKFNKTRMEDSAKNGFTNATDAADYLVKSRRSVQGRTMALSADLFCTA